MLLRKDSRESLYRVILPNLQYGNKLYEGQQKWVDSLLMYGGINRILFNWFSRADICFELVKACKDKEFIIGTSKRGLKINNMNMLNFNLCESNYFVLSEKPKTMYCSLANYSDLTKIGRVGFRLAENYNDYIKSYDFGIDIDSKKGFEGCYAQARKLYRFYSKFNIKFSVWSSGKKGWHFIVPADEMEEYFIKKKIIHIKDKVLFCRGLAEKIKKHLKIDVDMVVYSSSRYFKAPYSIDIRDDVFCAIYPLDKNQFMHFDFDFIDPVKLLKENVKNRGLYFMKSNPAGFEEMVKWALQNTN